ncbi:MAG: Beta-barrel assembly-enhancing protease [Planctomycetes bacterium]|nr:Beta-barrel assembly-enhancing protease [Planctomycetota bacterium]
MLDFCAMSQSSDLPTLDAVSALYESARFHDAWKLTQAMWRDRSLPARMNTQELVFAGRLAERLGSPKFRRALHRFARERDPDAPLVRYYCRLHASRRPSFFDELREFESNPHLNSGNPDLDASWYAGHAVSYALLRDFDTARHWIEHALQFDGDRVWVRSCQAEILLHADRWEEAHSVAREAWDTLPGMPYTAHPLASALDAMGRSAEVNELLLGHLENGGQSWEVADLALHFGARGLEQATEHERQPLFERLMALADRLLQLAPLADRRLHRLPVWHRTMLTRIMGDNAAFLQHASGLDTPYFKQIAGNMAANPGGARRIVPHRSVRQRHNTCFPASIATAATTFGLELDQDAISHELSFEGTATYRVDRWARGQDWISRPFMADRDSSVALLDAGVPFIVCLRALGAAHAMTAVGYDLAAGTLLLHDPGDGRRKEILLDRLSQGEAPLGPSCLVLLPPDQAARLDGITLSGEAAETAHVRYQEAINESGVEAAEAVAAEVERQQPGSPLARFLRGHRQHDSGAAAAALQSFLSLLSEYPDCALLQHAVLQSTAGHVDTLRLRDTLYSILTREPLPGIDGSRDWIYPAPFLYARYADLLLQSPAQIGAARRWIDRALRRDPTNAEAYHQLGELYGLQRKPELSLLPYRIASTLANEVEEFAISYVNVLYKLNRADEAVEFLRRRAEKYSGQVSGSAPRVSLIQAIEYFGRPALALETLESELRQRPQDGHLASFAADMFSRYGRMEQAHAALEVAKHHAPRAVWLRAVHDIAVSNGELEQALEAARDWLQETPHNLAAREAVLRLTEVCSGPDAILELAREWHTARPHDESLEDLYLDALEIHGEHDQVRKLLQARVKRNPHDGPAWRRLAMKLLARASGATQTTRLEKTDNLRTAVKWCRKTMAGQPATLALEAELALLEGDRERARGKFMQALEAEPRYFEAAPRVFELSRLLNAEQKAEVLEWATRSIERIPGQVPHAVEMAALMAAEFGFDAALKQVERWQAQSPHDPFILEARIRLHLDHGAGTSSIEAILPDAERAVADYPLQEGLHLALAEAYGSLFREDDAINLLHRLLAMSPRHPRARLMLSLMLEARGRNEEAEAALREALRRDPLQIGPWMMLADFLQKHARIDEALHLLEEANRRAPALTGPWERRAQLLAARGRTREAVEIGRELTRRFPRSSAAHVQLAQLLQLPGAGVPSADVEAEYQKAIKLDAEDLDALADYAQYLCERNQFDKARRMVEGRRNLFTDPIGADILLLRIERAQNRDNARRRLEQLLAARPDSTHAWSLYMTWIDEDKAWHTSRKLLEEMPAALRKDPALGSLRLTMLGLARVPVAELDRQWDELIFNFPTSMEVNLRRFDTLLDAGRLDDADNVMAVYQQHDDRSPQVLSRLVRVHCARKQFDDALSHAEKLWAYPGADGEQSSLSAMIALHEARQGKRVLKQVMELLEQGRVVQQATLRHCGQLCLELQDHRSAAKLLDALSLVARTPGDFELVGFMLDQLLEMRQYRRVIDWADARPKLARAAMGIWASVGVAYADANREADARRWLENWRDWPDVHQGIVSIYARLALTAGEYKRCCDAACEALERLEPTPAAGSLAESLFYGLIGQEQWQEFQQAHQRYSGALQGEQPSPMIEPFNCLYHLAGELPPARVAAIHQRIKVLASQGMVWMPPRILRIYNRMVKRKLGFLRGLVFSPLT